MINKDIEIISQYVSFADSICEAPCDRIEKALANVGMLSLPNNIVRCPTCGSACTIHNIGEGTNSFESIIPYREQD